MAKVPTDETEFSIQIAELCPEKMMPELSENRDALLHFTKRKAFFTI